MQYAIYMAINQIEKFNSVIHDAVNYVTLNCQSDPSMEAVFKVLSVKVSCPLKLEDHYSRLYPYEAIRDKMTYEVKVLIDYEIIWTTDNGTERVHEQRVPLWTIPIMVGSDYCNIARMIAIRERTNESNGYFIIDGSMKFVELSEIWQRMTQSMIDVYTSHIAKVNSILGQILDHERSIEDAAFMITKLIRLHNCVTRYDFIDLISARTRNGQAKGLPKLVESYRCREQRLRRILSPMEIADRRIVIPRRN